jgi:ElaB/YqjD/DUF883 family membrane-anchored ribosome-binding protein
MYKTKSRNTNRSDFDLYGDLAKIKAALADATYDVKGRASEILADSFEDVKAKSSLIQENVGAYVTERPIKSIGIAALAGLLVGYLLNK